MVYSITGVGGEDFEKSYIDQQLEDLGIPQDIIEQGEEAIKQYASQNSIDLVSFESDMSEQTASDKVKGANETAKQDYQVQLQSLGIPSEKIQEGDMAVKTYAAEKGITLPPPPDKGMNLNIML